MLFKAITLKNFIFAYCLLILYFNKHQNPLNICVDFFFFLGGRGLMLYFDLFHRVIKRMTLSAAVTSCVICVCALVI